MITIAVVLTAIHAALEVRRLGQLGRATGPAATSLVAGAALGQVPTMNPSRSIRGQPAVPNTLIVIVRVAAVERPGRRGASGHGPDRLGPPCVAMNGWAEPDPAWWLNLQSNPAAVVEGPTGRRHVVARAATPDERERLWARFVDLGTSAYTNATAATRSRTTAIVVLEPRPS